MSISFRPYTQQELDSMKPEERVWQKMWESGWNTACAILFILFMFFINGLNSGCAMKTQARELDPNYVQYIHARENMLTLEATRDRSLVKMEAHDDRPIQIDAKLFQVNMPAKDVSLPDQYRDFTAEATVQMWSNLGTAGIGMFGVLGQGIVGYLNHRETMGVMGQLARTGGGITLNADNQSSVHLSGGIGDREWSGNESEFTETGSPDFTVVRPEVVEPAIVKPEVVEPAVVTPEVVTPEVVRPEVINNGL